MPNIQFVFRYATIKVFYIVNPLNFVWINEAYFLIARFFQTCFGDFAIKTFKISNWKINTQPVKSLSVRLEDFAKSNRLKFPFPYDNPIPHARL